MSTNANSEEMKNQILGIDEVAEIQAEKPAVNYLGRGIVWNVYHKKNRVDTKFDGFMTAALMNGKDREQARAGVKKIDSAAGYVFTRK